MQNELSIILFKLLNNIKNFKKMKKLIVTLLLAVTVGSLANATTLETLSIDCVQLAFDVQTDLENKGMDKEEANRIATVVYDNCTATNGNIDLQD